MTTTTTRPTEAICSPYYSSHKQPRPGRTPGWGSVTCRSSAGSWWWPRAATAASASTPGRRTCATALRRTSWAWLARAWERRPEFPLTTRRRLAANARTAFDIGRDIGRIEAGGTLVPPAPKPRHLHSV